MVGWKRVVEACGARARVCGAAKVGSRDEAAAKERRPRVRDRERERANERNNGREIFNVGTSDVPRGRFIEYTFHNCETEKTYREDSPSFGTPVSSGSSKQ